MWPILCPIFTTLVLLIGGVAAFWSSPWHAQCTINWTFNEPCPSFKNRIINQMRAWQGDSLCPTGPTPTCPSLPCGQNCLYDFVSASGNTITGTHKTPVQRYIDDLTFTLTEQGGDRCAVKAFSTSRLWYAVLDMGTNYCNLRNLVDGAGYTNGQFTEKTSNKVCTQYTSRDCSRF